MAVPGGGGGLQLGGIKSGLQFGGTAGLQTGTTPQLGGGLSLGTSSAAGGFQLGSTPQTTSLGFAPGGLQLGTSQQTGGFLPQQRLGTGGGLQLGSTGGLSSATVQQPLSLGGMKLPSYTAATSLSTAGQTTGLQPGLNTTVPGLQATAAPLPTLSSLKPGGLPPPYLAGGLKLPGPTSTAATGAPTLTSLAGVKPGLTTQTGLKPTVGATAATGTALTGSTGAGGLPGKKYTYKQLEQLINKWSLELQEQEKVFLQQASQVNKWDRMLAENGDKIADLSEEVEAVKKEQKSMESELDLIETQQKELDNMLTTMEKDIDQAPNTGGYQADIQRTRVFQMAESVDSQLKRMAQDLKEIIEQMNEANRHQDEDSTFHQIVKILNAHTDSLGWIDRETALLKHKMEDIGKVTEHRKREQERSFRLAFDQ